MIVKMIFMSYWVESELALLKGDMTSRGKPLFWHYPHYANQGGPLNSVIRDGTIHLSNHAPNAGEGIHYRMPRQDAKGSDCRYACGRCGLTHLFCDVSFRQLWADDQVGSRRSCNCLARGGRDRG